VFSAIVSFFCCAIDETAEVAESVVTFVQNWNCCAKGTDQLTTAATAAWRGRAILHENRQILLFHNENRLKFALIPPTARSPDSRTSRLKHTMWRWHSNPKFIVLTASFVTASVL